MAWVVSRDGWTAYLRDNDGTVTVRVRRQVCNRRWVWRTTDTTGAVLVDAESLDQAMAAGEGRRRRGPHPGVAASPPVVEAPAVPAQPWG